MTTVYPGAIDNLSNPAGTTQTTDPTLLHSAQHANANDGLEATQTKLGTGGGAPPATPGILRRTGTGASGWDLARAGDYGAGSIGGGDISSAAALNIAGLTVNGAHAANGDITLLRAGSPTTGALFFGNSGTRYIFYNGALFQLAGSVQIDSALTVLGALSLPAGSVTGAMIADGTITTGDIAARNVTAFNNLQGSFGSIGAGAWSYTNIGITVGGLWPGASIVYGVFYVTLAVSTVNALIGAGIGIDSTAGPSYYVHAHVPAGAGWSVPLTIPFMHTATAGAHAYYGLVYVNAGTISAFATSGISAMAYHR